jgi:hypothetical protein
VGCGGGGAEEVGEGVGEQGTGTGRRCAEREDIQTGCEDVETKVAIGYDDQVKLKRRCK